MTPPTTGPDCHPFYRMTSREWAYRLSRLEIPHAHQAPTVSISNEYSAPGADNLPTFLYSVWVTCRIGDHHFFGHLQESAVFPVRSAAEEATA